MAAIKPGDIVFTKVKEGFFVYKILMADDDPQVFHVVLYKPLKDKPQPSDISKLEVYLKHLPVRTLQNYTFLGKQEVKKSELEEYYNYLKLIDFPRFLKESGAKVENIVNEANEAFEKGNEFYKEKDYKKAIEYFSKAVSAFPMFFEAVDNRGFAKMAIGELQDAITDFEFSLQINPENVSAQFAIGECFFKLEDFKKAKECFEKCLEIDPEDVLAKEWLVKTKSQIDK